MKKGEKKKQENDLLCPNKELRKSRKKAFNLN